MNPILALWVWVKEYIESETSWESSSYFSSSPASLDRLTLRNSSKCQSPDLPTDNRHCSSALLSSVDWVTIQMTKTSSNNDKNLSPQLWFLSRDWLLCLRQCNKAGAERGDWSRYHFGGATTLHISPLWRSVFCTGTSSYRTICQTSLMSENCIQYEQSVCFIQHSHYKKKPGPSPTIF